MKQLAKRIAALLLTLVMLVSASAIAPIAMAETDPAVQKLIADIAAIYPVDLEDEAAIAKAYADYRSMPMEQKAFVDNYDLLNDYQDAWFIIKAIADIGTVSDKSRAAVDEARQMYNDAADSVKELVTNYTVLTDAEYALFLLDNKAPANVISFSGLVGKYTGKDIDNSSLIPKYVPDDKVKMEDSGNGIQSPDWVKDILLTECNIYYAFGSSIYSQWDGKSPGLLQSRAKVEEVLSHLENEGVSAVWFPPVNDRNGSNGYGNAGMNTIDPLLTGTKDYEKGWQVFKEFVDKAHEHNIRVLIDTVTWGTTKTSPLYKEHPEFYQNTSAWGGWDFNWKCRELIDWYVDVMVDVVMKTGIDGFRCDCEPEWAGYAVFTRIRETLLKKGRKICCMTEIANDRQGNGYDFDEHFFHWSDPDCWNQSDIFIKSYNLVEAIKSPWDYAIIGSANAKRDGLCADYRFYGGLISCHDEPYKVKGNAVNFGYSYLFGPFLTIWYAGEEWNATGNGGYTGAIKWKESTDEDHNDFYNTTKRMIAIRRSYPEIFTYFPEHLYDSNICAVETQNFGTLQSYARYADGKAILIVPNQNAQADKNEFIVAVPFEEAGIIGDGKTVYEITELMSGKKIRGTRSELSAFKADIAYEHIGVFLVEAVANIPKKTTAGKTTATSATTAVDTEPISEEPITAEETVEPTSEPVTPETEQPTTEPATEPVKADNGWVLPVAIGAAALVAAAIVVLLIIKRKKA